MTPIRLPHCLAIISLLVLARPAGLTAGPPATRPTTQEFHLRIASDKKHYAIGEPIVVEVTISNLGPGPRVVSTNHPLQAYWVVALGPEGDRLPLSPDGRGRYRKAREAGYSWATLGPGESHTARLPSVALLFDMDLPTEYTLWVEYPARTDPVTRQKLIIASNEITVTLHKPGGSDATGSPPAGK